MRIIARPVLRQYADRHPELKESLEDWYRMLRRAAYRTPHEVREDFPTASFLGDGVTVFNIKSPRMEVHIRYDWQAVYVRFIGTHAEYDRRNESR